MCVEEDEFKYDTV